MNFGSARWDCQGPGDGRMWADISIYNIHYFFAFEFAPTLTVEAKVETFQVLAGYEIDEKGIEKKGSYAEYTLEELEELLDKILKKEVRGKFKKELRYHDGKSQRILSCTQRCYTNI